MAPKVKKSTQWIQCDKCSLYMNYKDAKSHFDFENKCQVDKENWTIPFIDSQSMYTFIEFTEFNDLAAGNIPTALESHHVMFLNLSAAILCNFVIGEYLVLIKPHSKTHDPIARRFLPVNNSAVTSALLSRKNLESTWADISDRKVIISKLPANIKIAKELFVIFPKDIKVHNSFQHHTKNVFKNTVLHKNNTLNVNFLGKNISLIIKKIIPVEPNIERLEGDWFEIVNSTKWTFSYEDMESSIKSSAFKIGGVTPLLSELKKIMNLVLKSQMDFKTILVKSVLLYGHSGTGKSLICNFLAKEYDCTVYNVNGPEIFSKYYGETESKLRDIFSDAIEHSPGLIIMNDIDNICSKKTSGTTDQEKRILSTLLALLDELHDADHKVFVLATSNKPDNIDTSLRRYGRIDKEIEVPVPTPENRKDILNSLLNGITNDLSADNIKTIADAAHGFVGADLMNLCTQASMHALQRESSDKTIIKLEDFLWAATKVTASAMREVLIEIPNVKWSDIGGQEDLKFNLKQAVEWPLKHMDSFKRFNIKPPSGVLMYGPPGCSKTMIAKALANESGLNFLSIKGPELFSKWVGESERAVRDLFRKARQVSPSIIFFDEIDALGSERSDQGSGASVHERVLAQLLTEMDGVVPLGNVTIIAATNRPDKIDKALLRPGRIDRIVYVPLPDKKTRLDIFNIKLSKMPIDKNVDVSELVERTAGYSGAEIQAVCHEAALKALEENIDSQFVLNSHFENALGAVKPRTPSQLLELYEKFSHKS